MDMQIPPSLLMACGQIVLNIKNTFSATFAQTKCLAAILLIIEKIHSVSVYSKI